MNRLIALAAAVFSDALRRRVLWVVALFALVLAAAIPSLPSYGEGVDDAVYREISLSLVYVAAMVVALVLAATRIPAELERRTAYTVLVRPVRRWEYVTGTWLGIAATMAVACAMFGAIVFATGWVVYGAPMPVLWQAVAAIWMEACVVAALCVAASTMLSAATVAVLALGFLFVAHVRADLLGGPGNPLWRFYPSLDTFNIIAPVAHGSGVSASYLLVMALVFAAWVGLLMLAAGAAFSRRDV